MSQNLPRSGKEAEFAAMEGASFNPFIALALAEKVGAKEAEAFFAERGRGPEPPHTL